MWKIGTMPEPDHRGEDEKWMRLAIAEARQGVGLTHPNPTVGAVIVKKNRLLAKGWHQAAGQPHAEIEAIRALRRASDARGATIFVTLEPCSTHGRTPPCTEAIAAAGFARVVYGARDPNPAHAGRADALLEKAGIAVTPGLFEAECAVLNRAWNKWIVTGRPYVIAKAGMSLDGRIASPPGRRWITSSASREDAMTLRATSQAILVGGETVRVDNPRLTLRGLPGRQQPRRVIWTKSGDLPPAARLFTDRHRARTLVYKNSPLADVLLDLGKKQVAQVLIEGGGEVLGAAFDSGLVDHVVFYIAPVLLGGKTPAVGGIGVGSNEAAIALENPTYTLLGNNLRISGDVRRASS